MEEENKTEVIESPNSCEISINAKGLWSGKIKVYAPTIEEATVTAYAKAEELQNKIAIVNKIA